MSWSWRVGRILGIDVFIHFTFPLIVAYFAWWRYSQTGRIEEAVSGGLFVLMLFGIVVLHELGHALAARGYGIRTRDITLLPIGGVARLERMPDDPKQELVVALAGPAVNAVIALGVYFGLTVGRALSPVETALVGGGDFVSQLLWVNIVLAVFNLLPAFPMDGGRVLRALLAMRMNYVKATQLAASLGQAAAFGFILLGFLTPNPFLILIGLFVWIGAAQEAGMAQLRASLQGIPVMRAMITDFQTLSPRDTLTTAVEHVLAGFQQDFPVLDDGRLVGILTRKDLMSGLGQSGPETAVADVMQRDFETTEPLAMLHSSFLKLQDCQCRTLPVVQNGRLVGLMTTDNLAEALMIQETLRHADGLKGVIGTQSGARSGEPLRAERSEVDVGRWRMD